MWDRETGEPIHSAIVWQDTRTGPLVRELAGDNGLDRLHDAVGLPLSTYFSGPTIRWLLDNIDGAQERAENGELAFGNIDTSMLWNLTGGSDGGVHATDVTNASRTMLMGLETLDWHERSLELMGIPRSMLARDPLVFGDLRRGAGHRHPRRSDLGHPRRSTGRSVRSDLL